MTGNGEAARAMPIRQKLEKERGESQLEPRSYSKSHSTSMAVWDVPTPMLPGKASVKIGVSCSDTCDLAGGRVEVCDRDGRRVAQARLGRLPFPGTSALYWTEARFRAPPPEGYHEWTARFLHANGDLLHHDASYKFGSMRAKPGLHELTVEVLDSVTREPIRRAYVRLGPSTVFSGEDGVARVNSFGDESVFVVWARSHRMLRTTVRVPEDRSMKVELTPSPCKYCPDST